MVAPESEECDAKFVYFLTRCLSNTVDAYTSDADSTVLKLMDDMENLLDTDEVELSGLSQTAVNFRFHLKII